MARYPVLYENIFIFSNWFQKPSGQLNYIQKWETMKILVILRKNNVRCLFHHKECIFSRSLWNRFSNKASFRVKVPFYFLQFCSLHHSYTLHRKDSLGIWNPSSRTTFFCLTTNLLSWRFFSQRPYVCFDILLVDFQLVDIQLFLLWFFIECFLICFLFVFFYHHTVLLLFWITILNSVEYYIS